MGTFGFGKTNLDNYSKTEKLSKYILNIQCHFRVLKNEMLVLGSNEMYVPRTDFGGSYDEFKWDIPGENLYDEIRDSLMQEFIDKEVFVQKIMANCFGDLKIYLSEDYVIEVFNNSCCEESWRFFDNEELHPHLVVVGQNIE